MVIKGRRDEMVNDVAALRRCGVEIDDKTKAMARRWTEARYGTTAGRKRAGGQVGGTRKRKAGGGSESSWVRGLAYESIGHRE